MRAKRTTAKRTKITKNRRSPKLKPRGYEESAALQLRPEREAHDDRIHRKHYRLLNRQAAELIRQQADLPSEDDPVWEVLKSEQDQRQRS